MDPFPPAPVNPRVYLGHDPDPAPDLVIIRGPDTQALGLVPQIPEPGKPLIDGDTEVEIPEPGADVELVPVEPGTLDFRRSVFKPARHGLVLETGGEIDGKARFEARGARGQETGPSGYLGQGKRG